MDPKVAPLWCKLATLDGTYELCMREFVFRFLNYSTGEQVFARYSYYDSLQDALTFLEQADFPLDFTSCISKTEQGRYRLPFLFKDSAQLARFITKRKPVSLEFGPICTVGDRDQAKKTPNFIFPCPLIFDIDVDDYDDMRTCRCRGKKHLVCDDCWKTWLGPAIEYLQHQLVEVFEYKSVLTFFSGRRGFHVWVLDKQVWDYSSNQRAAIYKLLDQVRFDRNVGTDVFHLIKAPLLVHPKSKQGWMSIPIDHTFVPSAYPKDINLETLIEYVEGKIADGKEAS